MSRTTAPAVSAGQVSRALGRDKLGIPAVVAFVLASIAPMTVCAGVIPTSYSITGLTGIAVAYLAVALILALFCAGYMAMSRRIRNAGAFYAFISHGLGRTQGVAAALVSLVAYESFQVATYGALGPQIQAEATAHLGITWPWWAWALLMWALVATLGLARVENIGRLLAVLTAAEMILVLIESAGGLASPAGGHLDYSVLSPSALVSAGTGSLGVLAVVTGLSFVGFEQTTVLAEEARSPRRTIAWATYSALAGSALLYWLASWAMEVHAGKAHVVGAATSEGAGLLFSLAGSGALAQAAQLLFITGLFAAAMSFHNVTWRYMFSLSREGVLPAALSRTSRASIPRAASLTQSASGLAVIAVFAAAGWPPMNGLFFGGGAEGGLGVMILLAATSLAAFIFLRNHPDGESAWVRAAAPLLSFMLLAAAIVLAVANFADVLGTSPGNPANWLLPAVFPAAAAAGAGWGLILRARNPRVYDVIGLGPRAVDRLATTSGR